MPLALCELLLSILSSFLQAEIIRLFIARGFSVNLKDDEGATPLDLAQENNHEECIRLLSGAGDLSPMHPDLDLRVREMRYSCLRKIEASAGSWRFNPCGRYLSEVGTEKKNWQVKNK